MSERLEEIKGQIDEARSYLDPDLNDGDYNYPKHDEIVLGLFDNKHIDWLIDYAKEQAERVQELEEIKSDAIKQIDVTHRRNERLEQRVQELEEDKKSLGDLIEETAKTAWDIEQQNKRYRKLIKEMGQEIEVLTDVMSNADNADELNEEVIRLKGMRGYENV